MVLMSLSVTDLATEIKGKIAEGGPWQLWDEFYSILKINIRKDCPTAPGHCCVSRK